MPNDLLGFRNLEIVQDEFEFEEFERHIFYYLIFTKHNVKKKKNRKLRMAVRILILVVIIIPILIIVFISPLTKYLVEKYDVKYTGREIKMDWAYVNPFTGYVYFKNLEIFESKSDSIFLSVNGVAANFTVHKLFSKNYEISELVLDELRGTIIQDKEKLNLDDLIEKFSPKGKPVSKKEPVHFSILSIRINNGEIRYREAITPINVSIIKLNLESTGIRWNADTIAAKFSFLSGIGEGDMKGDFIINTKNLDYRLAAIIHKFDLNFINQYLKDLANYGIFRASLDADVAAIGNFKDAQNLNAKGKLIVNEFHFGKDTITDFASFDKLVVDINQLSPKNHKYLFDSLLLMHPFLKYEQYDYLDNFQAMFGKKGSNISDAKNDPATFNLVLEIGKYITQLSKNFLSSYYQINRLAITDGDMQYNNYALNEKFSMSANPLFVTADSVDRNHKRVEVTFKSAVLPYGNASIFLSINPSDSSDFDMTYHFQKFPVSMFNPFLITYTSFPLDRGTIELNGKWNVRNGFIESTNHLLVIDPRVSKRIRKKDSKWIPLPLAMAFVRERGNVIDYEIPITGNLKNPKFHWKDVILDLVKNIFIKPPTTPYRLDVRNTENVVEQSQNIKWEMRQCTLYPNQQKFIGEMAEFLKDNPTAVISVYPIEYQQKEKEYILFFEAKKKYYLLTQLEKGDSFREEDSILVDKMKIKDSSFVRYVTKFCGDSMLNTIQQKCYRFIGEEIVNTRFNQLEKKRKDAFLFCFRQNGTASRVKIFDTKYNIPYNGFSSFKIKYNGDVPEKLNSAFEKMERMNREEPRKNYLKIRKKENAVPEQKIPKRKKKPLLVQKKIP